MPNQKDSSCPRRLHIRSLERLYPCRNTLGVDAFLHLTQTSSYIPVSPFRLHLCLIIYYPSITNRSTCLFAEYSILTNSCIEQRVLPGSCGDLLPESIRNRQIGRRGRLSKVQTCERLLKKNDSYLVILFEILDKYHEIAIFVPKHEGNLLIISLFKI